MILAIIPASVLPHDLKLSQALSGARRSRVGPARALTAQFTGARAEGIKLGLAVVAAIKQTVLVAKTTVLAIVMGMTTQ